MGRKSRARTHKKRPVADLERRCVSEDVEDWREEVDMHFKTCLCSDTVDEVDYLFDDDHRGPPVMNEDFVKKSKIWFYAYSSRFVSRNGVSEKTRHQAKISARCDRFPEAIFDGWAIIIRKRSSIYDHNGWRDDDGTVPDVICGPEFFRYSHNDCDANCEAHKPHPEMKDMSELTAKVKKMTI